MLFCSLLVKKCFIPVLPHLWERVAVTVLGLGNGGEYVEEEDVEPEE